MIHSPLLMPLINLMFSFYAAGPAGWRSFFSAKPEKK
jgi:hypothetical protein